jgi:3-hydroxypropanoate dehydrogenase
MVSNEHLDRIFNSARTYSSWNDKCVDDVLLHQIYELMKLGPTSANCCPLRIIFIKTKEAKEKLRPCLFPGNVDKTMSAPVVALLAYDHQFYDHLHFLFPPAPAKEWFTGSEQTIYEHGLRNSSLQIGYFIIAARSVGLDCGPMSGFDAQKVEEVFLKDTTWKINILCNLGYGKKEDLYPRLPRFSIEDVVRWA